VIGSELSEADRAALARVPELFHRIAARLER
jgi:hypothetical protein